MKSGSRLAGICLVAMASSAGSMLPAGAVQSSPTVPASLAVPAGNSVFLQGHAIGTQNYVCTSTGTWAFQGPEATLFSKEDHPIITHFLSADPAGVARPTWQATDGSTVWAKKTAGASVTSNAIPWLTLQATATAPGADGERLVGTTYIQRINTSGGLAPSTPCTSGTVAKQPYQADYYFFASDAP